MTVLLFKRNFPRLRTTMSFWENAEPSTKNAWHRVKLAILSKAKLSNLYCTLLWKEMTALTTLDSLSPQWSQSPPKWWWFRWGNSQRSCWNGRRGYSRTLAATCRGWKGAGLAEENKLKQAALGRRAWVDTFLLGLEKLTLQKHLWEAVRRKSYSINY